MNVFKSRLCCRFVAGFPATVDFVVSVYRALVLDLEVDWEAWEGRLEMLVKNLRRMRVVWNFAKLFDTAKTRMIRLSCGKNYDDMLSRFHTIPKRNGQTELL